MYLDEKLVFYIVDTVTIFQAGGFFNNISVKRE